MEQTSNTTCRRFMQIWPGGFAVWLGKLHPQEMQAVITSFTHNRYHNGLGRPLKRCEREMLELQWFSAQEFEDVIRLATPATKISLAGMQKGDSLRRFLSENWATDFAKCPRNDDQLAFRLFCQGQGWDTTKLRSLTPKPAGIPAGAMPCCINVKTGLPMVLLGREHRGWCCFQGNADSCDTSLLHTACREAAEELCSCLGDAGAMMDRFFLHGVAVSAASRNQDPIRNRIHLAPDRVGGGSGTGRKRIPKTLMKDISARKVAMRGWVRN
uniref:Uncharacterized protein n=1 Tax=Octactis speculum TaxID=3111310 RepID=A0A7S2CP81_9STRA|mmetsp:Transcript_38366/g.51980  ORF Transcript_38366/g.51980 Transcript_38366/m.51980 type:complete len:270 (+) Transcript_38366:10-819(+)